MKATNHITNTTTAYQMACLENAIRWEYASARLYAERASSTDKVYNHMIERASTMISAFEIAFGVNYF